MSDNVMTASEQKAGNEALIQYLQETLDGGTKEVTALRTKLAISYWVIIVLSIVMFLVGIILISIPALASIKLIDGVTDAGSVESIISVIAGLADLIVLFLAKPVKQVHNLMGDMAQLTLSINSFRYQVGLRLLQMRVNEPDTVGDAAKEIRAAAKSSIKLIETFFEHPEESK